MAIKADLIKLELPVTECLDDSVGRTRPERSLFSAPFARHHDGRILLIDNQLRVSFQQPDGLARRIVEAALGLE